MADLRNILEDAKGIWKDSLSPQELKALILTGESQSVEFKTGVTRDSDIAQVLAGMANGAGGVLLVGVADDGTIVGPRTTTVAETAARLVRIAANLFEWPTSVGSAVVDGTPIVYHIIPPAPAEHAPVVTATGDVWLRQADRTVKLSLRSTAAQRPAAPKASAAPQMGPINAQDTPAITLYVGMSYREEEEPHLVDYLDAITRAAESLRNMFRIAVLRTDSGTGDHELTARITSDIDRSDVVLCDFTLNPRNVYYELGFARGRGKVTIQSARKDTDLEFNIRNIHSVIYRNARELQIRLVPELSAACARVVEPRAK